MTILEKKIKIAMIGPKTIPSKLGGIEVHVEEIVKRLVERGYDVIVYCRSNYSNANLKNYKGVHLKYMPSINTKHLDTITYSIFSSVNCIFNNYDIVHYHALGPSLLSFLPRIFGKKVVSTVHRLDWKGSKWNKIAKLILKIGEKATVIFPNKVIVVSKTLKKYYEKKYNNNPIYIPNGIEERKIEISTKEINLCGLEKNEYILFLARLVPEKGAHYLIDAYNKLNTNKKLVIAGGSSHSDKYVESLHDKSKENKNIIFTGFVEGKILDELYQNAYIYILPSETEGLPISLLEALSYGQCCLVSDIEENLEVIDNYGYKFESKNIESLYKNLKYLLENEKEVIKLKKESKEYILNKYNWDNIVEQLDKVYTEMLNFKIMKVEN